MSLKPEYWKYLVEIAKAGGFSGKIPLSTSAIGDLVGVSQQTASRRLRYLQDHGYITKFDTSGNKVQEMSLAEKGIAELRQVHEDLSMIFATFSGEIVLHGKVIKGLGEGKYYVSKYLSFFEQNLGIEPYPGTLNVRLLSDKDIALRSQIELHGGALLRGFTEDERSFGDVFAYKVTVARGEPGSDEVEAYFLKIARTHYDRNVLELISDKNLRDTLQLADEDYIKIVYAPPSRPDWVTE